MRPKLIALDLDGTLMGKDRAIARRTRRAVERAMDRGCLVAMATGRAFSSAARFAKDLELNAPLICFQGAMIRDYRDGTTVYVDTIPLDSAREVIAFSQARQLNVQVYLGDDQSYTDQVNSEIARLAEIAQVPVSGVGNLAKWLDRPPLKFLYFVEQEEAAPELVRDLKSQFDHLQIVRSWHQIVEITGPDVSKGSALMRLAECLETPQLATMAVGDQDNDVSMIAWAGLGVAMGDASPAAKAAADVVAPPLEEEGAAWAIEHYVLDGAQ
jgi:Cof subfamily protein (haloacid dehalogenase superfamily)